MSATTKLLPDESREAHLKAGFDRLPPVVQDEPVAAAAPSTQTTFDLTPQGAERKLLGSPVLALKGDSPSKPTVLRMGVNPSGAVTAVLLEKSSGNNDADQGAMQETARWHFVTREDALENEVDWLIVTIHWAMAPAKKEAAP